MILNMIYGHYIPRMFVKMILQLYMIPHNSDSLSVYIKEEWLAKFRRKFRSDFFPRY